jgi:predicted O-methyltransferase YrrM
LPLEFEKAKKVLEPYDCEFIQKFSMDAIHDFKDKSLDFVYIDAAHDFKHVAEDLCEWTRKVRVGGIVFGHDFKRAAGNYVNDVKDVVPAYCYAHRITPWFVLGQPGPRDGLFSEGTQSWMFVRQETDKIWL